MLPRTVRAYRQPGVIGWCQARPAGGVGRMGHLEVNGVGYRLPDGRALLDEVTLMDRDDEAAQLA